MLEYRYSSIKNIYSPVFETRIRIRIMRLQAMALGIVEHDRVIQTVAECRSIVSVPSGAVKRRRFAAQ